MAPAVFGLNGNAWGHGVSYRTDTQAHLERLHTMAVQRLAMKGMGSFSLGPWLLLSLLLLITVLVAGQGIVEFFERLELKQFALRQMQVVEDRTQSGVDVVGIDEATLSSELMRRSFGRFPYQRDAYATLVQFMNRVSARVVAFDMSFDGGEDHDHPERDAAFANSIQSGQQPGRQSGRQSGRTWVLSGLSVSGDRFSSGEDPRYNVFWQQQWFQLSGRPADQAPVGVFRANSFALPILPLVHSPMAFYPFHAINDDLEGNASRTIPFVTFSDGHVLPSMPLAVAMGPSRQLEILPGLRIRTQQRMLDLAGQSYPIIRWYGDMRGLKPEQLAGYRQKMAAQAATAPAAKKTVYRHFSLAEVVRSEMTLRCRENAAGVSGVVVNSELCRTLLANPQPILNPDTFRNRIILVGTTGNALVNSDIHKTIYDGAGNYPGVFIQANIIDNYLHNGFVHQAGIGWTLGFSSLMLLLALWIAFRSGGVVRSLVLVLALLGNYTWLCHWIYLEHNVWLNWVYPTTSLIGAYSLTYLARYVVAEQRRQRLRYGLAKYVSPAVMETVEAHPERLILGGQRREMTILFCDIRGFTSFSETNPPEVVQDILVQYFADMNEIILSQYRGTINKLMGDAIMAYWGFPLQDEDDAFLAVSAALAMKEKMEERLKDETRVPIRIGIGINTGDVLVGNIGSEQFMDFTVIGDNVNIASRLEGMNKEFKTTIIISEATYQKVKDRIRCFPLGSIRVRGKQQETLIYEPLGVIKGVTRLPNLSASSSVGHARQQGSKSGVARLLLRPRIPDLALVRQEQYAIPLWWLRQWWQRSLETVRWLRLLYLRSATLPAQPGAEEGSTADESATVLSLEARTSKKGS
ncbi:MAG: adenylate/guanylate cyclase domain-containing protein [Candidatus Melainabacteria bacterium]|nr:adenylate/guanylate cyclase domain-containing protein [Candidatus Melainabacteria bacterium]